MTNLKVSRSQGVVKASQELVDQRAADAARAEADRLPNARTAAIERIEAGYRQALRSFAHAGTTWDASDDSATVLRDLLNRLANDRGLPRGKDTVTLRDTAGTAHDVGAEAVKDLGAAGSDHRDACLETRLTLLDQIAAAVTVADLDAIDWPD